MFDRLRWRLADWLRPNVWPSTAAQHGVLLEQIKELEGEREWERVRRISAEFVLYAIATGIPFRNEKDPRTIASKFLGPKLGIMDAE